MRDAKTIAMQVHRKRAVAVLGDDPACKWLSNRPEVLDELGRINNDCALLAIAKRICQLKASSGEAIEMIRRHREFDRLADDIVRVVNDYVVRHPATRRSEIIRALETAGMLLSGVEDASQAGRHQFLRRM